jgi:hypothetical protein
MGTVKNQSKKLHIFHGNGFCVHIWQFDWFLGLSTFGLSVGFSMDFSNY